MVHVRLQLGLPTTRDGREFFALGVNVRVTTIHLVVSGAVALGILWLVLQKRRATKELVEADERPVATLRAAP